MSDWEKTAERIDSYTDDLVDFQSALVACPALGPVNGGDGEAEKTRIIEERVDRLGPDETIRIDAPDDRVSSGVRPNLIALFKGTGGGRVWVLSHTDVVPAGEERLWESSPFKLVRDGDVIRGRGVEDNHQGVVSSYFAVKAILEEGLRPEPDVGLIFVADEETGSGLGLEYVLQERPDLFSADDLIIAPDAGSEDGTLVEIAEKSMCWIRFRVTGRQCHASTPHKGVNSMRTAARMICDLDEALPRVFDERDELFTLPISTFEPTKKEANVPNVNTIPGEDVFYFDCRVLPGRQLDEVTAEARRIAEETALRFGAGVEVEAAYRVQAPRPTSPDAPVVQALARGIRTALGREARPQGVGGGTVAAFFRRRGLPAAVWSTISGTAHAPNESARISDQLGDAKVFAHVFLGL